MSNPNIMPWTRYQDIQSSEKDLRTQFDAYMSAGNYAGALELLRTKEEKLKGRAYVAKCINEIISTAMMLENEINNKVNLYLSELATNYFNLIDNFRDLGVWNVNYKYQPYNFVQYNDKIYLCIVDVPVGVTPDNEGYWLKIGLFGQDGSPGIDVKMKLRWLSNKGYFIKDVVEYNGTLYVAKKNNMGIEPGTDDATWGVFLVIAKGGIHVGVNPPEDPVPNTLWFRTRVDPIKTTGYVIGDLVRYQIVGYDGIWEQMFPTTLFTLVEGVEEFAPKATVRKIAIQTSQWGLLYEDWVVIYKDPKITDTSYVEVMPNMDTAKTIYPYADLKMTVAKDTIIFKMPYKPDVMMTMTIKIQ